MVHPGITPGDTGKVVPGDGKAWGGWQGVALLDRGKINPRRDRIRILLCCILTPSWCYTGLLEFAPAKQLEWFQGVPQGRWWCYSW